MANTDPVLIQQALDAVAATTPDFLYAFDTEGRFIYANRSLLEVWGLSLDEALGKTLYQLGYPHWHAEMHMQELRQVIESKKPVRGEVPFTGGSGIAGVYEYIFTPVLDAQGRVVMVTGTTREVGGRRTENEERGRIEKVMQESEARLRAIVEATPECVKIVSPEGKLLFMNHAGLGMVEGDESRSVLGGCVYDLIAPEHREDWIGRHRRVCGGAKLTWEFDIIGLRGTRRTMETHAVPIPLPGGITGQLAVTRDVTGRKEDERVQAHLAAIVATSDDAIVSKTLEGIIQTWNTGAQRIFGYTAQETVGRSILMLIPPDRHHEEDMILSKLRAGERIEHYESVRMTKDGRLIDVSLTISPMRDSSGRIIGASKIARDITRQKQAERDLKAAKAEAEELNRQKDELLKRERAARGEAERASHTKDEFLATLSHELRTPLNAILGWSQILRHQPNTNDITEGVEIIERNARVQTQIIEDLLDMSRIISGKMRLDVQQVDLSAVVKTAVETAKPAADAKSVRLQTILDPLAGPVRGDPNRLQQVFWNLLTNAVKFTPKGGRVQVALERVNSHLEVSVIDTGEGIDPDFLPHVFDRFRQAQGGTARKHGGLGLGLAIVKQLVELHGGTVRVKSGGKGMGSTFTVSLPLTVIHPEPNPDVLRRHPSATAGMAIVADACVQIEGVRILVVDDEPDARSLVRRLLEDCKAVVTTASSAEEALQLVSSDPPDVLVSDIGMPGEDGYSLIKKIRALGEGRVGDVPAIALTAYARPEDRMTAVLAGFEQYLVKPVEAAELITLVSVLASRRQRKPATGGIKHST